MGATISNGSTITEPTEDDIRWASKISIGGVAGLFDIYIKDTLTISLETSGQDWKQ